MLYPRISIACFSLLMIGLYPVTAAPPTSPSSPGDLPDSLRKASASAQGQGTEKFSEDKEIKFLKALASAQRLLDAQGGLLSYETLRQRLLTFTKEIQAAVNAEQVWVKQLKTTSGNLSEALAAQAAMADAWVAWASKLPRFSEIIGSFLDYATLTQNLGERKEHLLAGGEHQPELQRIESALQRAQSVVQQALEIEKKGDIGPWAHKTNQNTTSIPPMEPTTLQERLKLRTYHLQQATSEWMKTMHALSAPIQQLGPLSEKLRLPASGTKQTQETREQRCFDVLQWQYKGNHWVHAEEVTKVASATAQLHHLWSEVFALRQAAQKQQLPIPPLATLYGLTSYEAEGIAPTQKHPARAEKLASKRPACQHGGGCVEEIFAPGTEIGQRAQQLEGQALQGDLAALAGAQTLARLERGTAILESLAPAESSSSALARKNLRSQLADLLLLGCQQIKKKADAVPYWRTISKAYWKHYTKGTGVNPEDPRFEQMFEKQASAFEPAPLPGPQAEQLLEKLQQDPTLAFQPESVARLVRILITRGGEAIGQSPGLTHLRHMLNRLEAHPSWEDFRPQVDQVLQAYSAPLYLQLLTKPDTIADAEERFTHLANALQTYGQEAQLWGVQEQELPPLAEQHDSLLALGTSREGLRGREEEDRGALERREESSHPRTAEHPPLREAHRGGWAKRR